MNPYLIFTLILLYSNPLLADLQLQKIEINNRGELAIGIYPSQTKTRGDILFLHGHADRLENHIATFQRWSEEGFRTLSLDLPQHGNSNLGPLDSYTMQDLITLIKQLERYTREDEDRPLILSGWSFGGLLATRLMQQNEASINQRPIIGLFLITPAIAVLPLSGGDGIARLATLTSNTLLKDIHRPSPRSPMTTPLFAVRLLHAAWLASNQPLPAIPTAVVLAGDRSDWYIDTARVREWVKNQQKSISTINLWQCKEAMHALELEPYPTGHWVREFSSGFFNTILTSMHNQSLLQWDKLYDSECAYEQD